MQTSYECAKGKHRKDQDDFLKVLVPVLMALWDYLQREVTLSTIA